MSEENMNTTALVPLSDTRKRTEQLAVQNHHMATTVASLCTEMVERTAIDIQGGRHVPAASWEAIATAHGFVVGTGKVQWVPPGEDSPGGGFRAIGSLKNLTTGEIVAEAEGFVGADEPLWFGGVGTAWDRRAGRLVEKTYPKRSEHAIRAFAQTRAAARVCKQAFAHVVVMMNKGLSTTPAEEMQLDPEDSGEGTGKQSTAKPEGKARGGKTRENRRERVADPNPVSPPSEAAKDEPVGDWRDVRLHWPQQLKGQQLGELSTARLEWFHTNFQANLTADDRRLRAALDLWHKATTSGTIANASEIPA